MWETIIDIAQIIFADIILSGDNALVIGMAAASLPAEQRQRAIFAGMALAAGLRIVFAVMASYLISIPGILFFGGLLLAWVCWRFYSDINNHGHTAEGPALDGKKQFWGAMATITLADISMSIDNVLAVAAIARDNTTLLVFGLALAIAFMALCSQFIMRMMTKYPMLSWAGLMFLVYLTTKMLWDGWPGVAELLKLA